MKAMLLMLLMIGFSNQICNIGCLKCTLENKCILCDTLTFYKAENDSCVLVDQPNCNLINLGGDCLRCENGYWLNNTTKKCVVVQEEKRVKNCASYSSTQNCLACRAHFVSEFNICKAVTNKLNNCDEYQTMNTCGRCEEGFFLSSDQKTCVSVPKIKNCHFFSRFKCESCSKNYIFNRNYYLNSSFKISTNLEKEETLNYILIQKECLYVNQNTSVCQKNSVNNCSEHETFNTCRTCSPGYFIKKDKTCGAYPKPRITNCSIYSSNDICSQCNQGFYRVSSSECKNVTQVENCTEYSTISNLTECKKCEENFYLSSNNSCTERKVSANSEIANCQKKSLDYDGCSLCNTGFVLSSGQDECSIKVLNCKVHKVYTKGSIPNCKSCSDGFYLSNNICVAGSDSNCLIYLNNGTCDLCRNKYFLFNSNSCTEHTNISNCDNYHNTIKNTCKTCDASTFNFEIVKKCKLLTEILNCVAYNHSDNASVASCSACNDGYFLTNPTTCTKIEVASCKTGTSTTFCTSCMDDFVLFKNGEKIECRLPHDYMTEECETINVTSTGGVKGLNYVTCSSCKINALPINYENNYVCIKEKYIKDANTVNKTNKINYCIKYNGNDCVLCENNKFLKSDFSECLDDCGSNALFPLKMLKITDPLTGVEYSHVGYYNLCDSTASDVAIKGYDKQDIRKIIDIKCKTGLTAVTSSIKNSLATSNISLNGNFDNWIEDIGTSNPKVNCPNSLATNINETRLSTLIDNCQYYKKGSTDAKYGCIKCKHGYHGKPNADFNIDKNFFIVDCESKMESCNSSVEYKNIEGRLSQFFSCHKCNNENKIPYLIYEDDSDEEIKYFKKFSLTSSSFYPQEDRDGHTIECLDVSSVQDFKNSIGATNSAYIFKNCALGLLSTTNSDKTTGNIKSSCAACKPGYYPDNLPKITSCSVIKNCSDSSNWLNACSLCASGFAFKVETGKIDYTKCVKQNDIGCFASDRENNNCSFCKKGYVLNKDGLCEKINTPKCQNGKYVPLTRIIN